ncbi:hypothetical protein [[Haemophilus] ducreyi]|nr:hypothetical protein [[Haemophilus] ducreyi]
MQLHEYLLCRVDGPSQLLSVSSIDRLFNRLWQVCEGGMKDIEALTEVMTQCPDITNCGDFKLPWCFIKARLIYRQVNRGTHPVIRLYRQYEYLFCSVERTLHCTSYLARRLFN